MELLKQRILENGKNLGNGILKIDGILNHQIDTELMAAMGKEIARRFAGDSVSRILTAEVSGIAPALIAGIEMGVPVVYARKRKPITMKEPVFVDTAPSHTKGGDVVLMVSPEYLMPDDRILIIDDFLASGQTIAALARIVESAGAKLAGICCVVEKTFEGGREMLAQYSHRIEALAVIKAMTDDEIIFGD